MSKKTILISSLAALIVIGAGAWVWEKKSAQKEEVKKQEEVKQEETNEIDTSDWQAYRNEELGFELKYPSDWIVNMENSRLWIYSSKVRENIPEGGGAITIETKSENLNDFIKKYESLDVPHSKIIHQEEYVLDGAVATKLFAKTAIGIDQNFIFLTRNKNLVVSFYDFDKYHLKILSTFKFTD